MFQGWVVGNVTTDGEGAVLTDYTVCLQRVRRHFTIRCMFTSSNGYVPNVSLALAIALTACDATRDSAYEFALVGDNPYGPTDVPRFEALIDDVNGQSDLRWVIHVGDVQSGQRCTDELFQTRFDLYQRFALPFVYTPGDNDWFDCRREAWGGFDEYERLDRLRSLFFPNPASTTGGRRMDVRSQSAEPDFEEFVENVMWVHEGVVFSTIHLVWLTRLPTNSAIAMRRMDAAIAWIRLTFAVAAERQSVGVFLATQADPWIVSGLPFLCEACSRPTPGLERLYPALIEASDTFNGPVVIAVGDTHIFRVDKPLYRADSSLVENFTRVEVFGDPAVHWVRVSVDPRTREVFSFHQELVPANISRRPVP